MNVVNMDLESLAEKEKDGKKRVKRRKRRSSYGAKICEFTKAREGAPEKQEKMQAENEANFEDSPGTSDQVESSYGW